MADITATQKQALSGMNLSDHEKRMKELEAELEAVKARIAETKANIANLKADQKLIESAQPPIESAQPAKEEIPFAPDRGLTGIRDEDGTLVTAKDQEARLDAQKEAGKTREDEIYEEMYGKKDSKFSQDEINQMSTDEMIEEGIPVQQSKVLEVDDDTEESWLERTQRLTQEATERQDEGKRAGIEREDEIYEDMYGEEEEVVEEEVDKDEAGSKGLPKYQRDMDKDTDGRKKDTEIENLRGEKPGYKKGDSDYWSVNEKDDYWKTEEGYEEAVNLYGKRPSWLKAQDVGTLVYNPSTGEYEEVEQEEFVDLKPYKKRISL